MLLGAVLVFVLALLSRLRVMLTPSGVHAGVSLSLAGDAGIRMPSYAGSGEGVRIPGMLAGPVIRGDGDGKWSAEWFCEDRTHRASGRDSTLTLRCGDRSLQVRTIVAPIPEAVAAMPDSVVVLSDIEGNSAFLDAALQQLGVMDAAGNWRFGRGHLVMLGDYVDRGRDVFPVECLCTAVSAWRTHSWLLTLRA